MMKQLIRLGLMLVAVLAMVSCTPSTPGAALKNYMSALSDKDYENSLTDATSLRLTLTKLRKYARGLLP